MDCQSLDPYEKQLFTVFESYDYENCGTLDERGLTQLCQSLHLEDQATELIQQLLKEREKHRVTFNDFKNGLLALLGKIQGRTECNESDESENEKRSPDREVSPKYVYGSKKYGRRTRPKIEEEDENENLMNNYENESLASIPVQKSSSHGDVLYSKKRKTNTKLKRCTSLPGKYGHHFHLNSPIFDNVQSEQEFLCTEEMLREAWKKLGVGKDGYLNRNELVLVCNAIGLEKLAKGVLRQLSFKKKLDINQKISFQELLQVLQEDETWSDVLGPSSPINKSMDTVHCLKDDTQVSDPENIQYVTLGPNATGYIHTDVIIEMWDNAGIPSPKKLIQDLGFDDCQVRVADLATILEKEIKSMGNSRNDYSYLHVTLLQAVLTLYQSEIRSLRNILEQMHAEREKLKCDVIEANNRASLLAQEVDDNHARMEKNTQNHVKLLEQKHAEILKDATDQFTAEKEHMMQMNQVLEQKIKSLEGEETKLREELNISQSYSSSVEKENQTLNGRIAELQQEKLELTEHISFLEAEKENCCELENKQLHVEQLLAKLSTLQMENAELRDKNDEMVAEIEQLLKQISAVKTKGNSTPTFNLDEIMDDSISISMCEGLGAGSKRRNEESPTKEFNPLGLYEGSPRLGKVRKYQKEDELLVVQSGMNESGFDGLSLSASSSSVLESEDVQQLKARIGALEDLLRQHSIALPETGGVKGCGLPDVHVNDQTNLKHLMTHCKELEKVIAFTKDNIKKILDGKDDQKEIAYALNEALNRLSLSTSSSTNQTDDFKDLQEELKKCQDENKELRETCSELENCIQLLKDEYERCEDYWSQKLDEERRMFEDEQNQSSEKLQELINKMTEYEIQFGMHDNVPEYGLPPIEENNLEAQFIDLEREFEEYRYQTEKEMLERDEQISRLQQEIDGLKLKKKEALDASVQVNAGKLPERVQNILSTCLVEKTDLYPSDALPELPSPSHVPPDLSSRRESPSTSNSYKELRPSETNASTSTESTLPIDEEKAVSKYRKFRRQDRNYLQKLCRKSASERKSVSSKSDGCKGCCGGGGGKEDRTVVVPISMFQSLNNRLHHLEQRCKHLQSVLKQQHCHAEQVLQSSWQQFRGEKAELQFFLRKTQEKLENQIRVCNDQMERLTKTDMLVKDLYVENSYLIANVQRLESQCHMLSQFNSSSSI